MGLYCVLGNLKWERGVNKKYSCFIFRKGEKMGRETYMGIWGTDIDVWSVCSGKNKEKRLSFR